MNNQGNSTKTMTEELEQVLEKYYHQLRSAYIKRGTREAKRRKEENEKSDI